MRSILFFLLICALIGVLVVLGLGFTSLVRGGDPRRSNKLMQSRVLMQAIAIFLLAMLMLFGRR